jgi:hypothetical protein
MTDDDKEARIEMSAAFALTDEGLMAFLSGLVDSVLRADGLQPKDGDTPQAARIKTLSRDLRDPVTKMLDRLSGLDEMSAAIGRGEPMWPSQNLLSDALGRAFSLGTQVAKYAAPHRELTDEESKAIADQIEDLCKNDPAARKIIEDFQRLHPEADE